MRQVVGTAVVMGALALAACQKKDVLVARVDAVYTPAQVLKSDRRLGALQQQATAVPLPDGDIFLVVASRITNPTRQTQRLDQDKVLIVDEFDNTFSRIGLTVDCSDAPSVMEYDGKLDKIDIQPGATLAGDTQATCFVFAVPAGDRHFRLRLPGATDTPTPLPARKIAASAPVSASPPLSASPAPSSAETPPASSGPS
jgi:hypothetical protein